MDSGRSPPWAPVLSIIVNFLMSVHIDPVQCSHQQLPDGVVSAKSGSGLLRLLLLFAGLSLGLELLWKLRTPHTAIYRCILSSVSLFAIPLGAVLPTSLSHVFRCIMQSWDMSHILVLVVSLYILVSSHCPPANTTVELSKEPTRPVEIMMPSSCEKTRAGPTCFHSPSIRGPSAANPVATPAKLASERRRPLESNSLISDAPEREIQEESSLPVAPLGQSTAAAAFPIGTSLRAVAGGGISFPGIVSDGAASASKQRVAPPVWFYEGIRDLDEKEPEKKGGGAKPPQADDFWKKHSLWCDVDAAEAGDPDIFRDTHHTLEAPFKGTTVEKWLLDSQDPEYFSNQPVFSLLSPQMKDSIMRAYTQIPSHSSPPPKFYWLLLRFVYSSSQMQDPKHSWWYKEPTAKDGNTAPDNFCLVLQELQKYPGVFVTYSNFHRLIWFYFEGLKRDYHSGKTSESTRMDNAIKRMDWIRSRPLLGVQNAKKQFLELLEKLKKPQELLKDNLAESKCLTVTDENLKAQVCIAMVPGGCVIKHPHAELELGVGAKLEPNESLWNLDWPDADAAEDSALINRLKFTFWMHNARGFANRLCRRELKTGLPCAFFFDKANRSDPQNDYSDHLRKKNFVHEAVEYFKKLWNAPNFRDSENSEFHPSLLAVVLFDRIGDKLMEDQSAQIFSDIIFKLSMEPAGQRISGMAHAVAGLCGWQCRLGLARPEACVEFVNRRQDVYGMNDGTRWDSSEDDRKWVGLTSLLRRGQDDVRQRGTYSGIAPMYQAVTPDYLPMAPPAGTIPFFDWYPATEHLEVTARRAMDKEVFGGNLRWNSRVIVMDLLLLLEKNRDSDSAKRTALRKQMFPMDQLPKDSRYESVRKISPSLWLFFVHFWEPALENFRKVFESGSKDKHQEATAVGEVCLVLGITCRTQWMQIGFLHTVDFKKYATKSSSPLPVEYLPCRFDRLLSLLHERHSDSLQIFVRDIADIFKRLLSRQTEANFDMNKIPRQIPRPTKEKEVDRDPERDPTIVQNATEQKNYFQGTKHFLLNESFYAWKDGCDDPRKTTNVYLFALLDVSMAFHHLVESYPQNLPKIEEIRDYLSRYGKNKEKGSMRVATGIHCGTNYKVLQAWVEGDLDEWFCESTAPNDPENAKIIWDPDRDIMRSSSTKKFKYEFVFHLAKIGDNEDYTTPWGTGKVVGCSFHPEGFFKVKH